MSNLIESIKTRRTHYALAKKSPVSNERVIELVEQAVLHTPTAFNSQNGRVVVLLAGHHNKVWQFAYDALKAIVPADQFPATSAKIDAFAGAYGTVLFFEDMATVKALQDQFPLYAGNFPIWSQQANGMLQSNVWVALSESGLGASLQHYSELIENQIRQEWEIPADWKLVAQMPFGQPLAEPSAKDFAPVESRVKVFA
ncbi:MAG: nitroreductase family protein [Eubacteriales bacterium]|nr:nitroreductase family protein [Eubacteriales bacterium]